MDVVPPSVGTYGTAAVSSSLVVESAPLGGVLQQPAVEVVGVTALISDVLLICSAAFCCWRHFARRFLNHTCNNSYDHYKIEPGKIVGSICSYSELDRSYLLNNASANSRKKTVRNRRFSESASVKMCAECFLIQQKVGL
jgi:hypothetical protein